MKHRSSSYLPGPIDVALWDICAKEASLPLYKYIGAYRNSLPVYASGNFHATVQEYVDEALYYKSLGVPGYKAHPGGPVSFDMEIHQAVRDAVGPEYILMSDPVAEYTMGDAVAVGSQICYPYLKASPHKGRIINISSMSAHLGFTQVVPYCTSKAAVCGMTRGLAIEWASDNICVNSIAPGWFHSKMLDDVMDDNRREKILNRIAVHDFGDVTDLGAMAKFLIGPNGSYITGQDYAVDGGTLAFGY